MKIRTIIITAVLTLSMVAGMAGCAGGKDAEPAENKEETKSEVTDSVRSKRSAVIRFFIRSSQ